MFVYVFNGVFSTGCSNYAFRKTALDNSSNDAAENKLLC